MLSTSTSDWPTEDVTENPFKKEYWLGTVDPRPLALFRLLFGSVILVDYLSRLSEVPLFLSDEGFAPRHAMATVSPSWSLFLLVGSPTWAVMLLYLAGVLAAAALMAGYRTRFAQAALFLFEAWMTSRNPAFTTGADHLIGVMSFWLLFANTGAVWSIPIAPERRRGRGPSPPSDSVSCSGSSPWSFFSPGKRSGSRGRTGSASTTPPSFATGPPRSGPPFWRGRRSASP